MSMIDSISNNVPDKSGNHTQRLDVRQPAPDRATNPLNIPSMATYLPSTTTELESSNELPPTLPAADSKKFDREKLQALIKKLAINTGFVMCIGIGFILVAKQFFKAKSTSQKKKAQSPIQIKSTLKLSPKSNLHLIEASEHRLIVATDQNGIKSMVRLTESFGSTLGTLEELMDDDAGDSSDTKRKPEANNAGAYSLATLALSRAQANADSAASIQRSLPELDNTPLNSTAKKTPAESASGGNDQDEIRRQMEEALRDHGLKELIMETLRKDQK